MRAPSARDAAWSQTVGGRPPRRCRLPRRRPGGKEKSFRENIFAEATERQGSGRGAPHACQDAHNYVLRELLGLSADEVERLIEAEGVH